MAEPIDWTHFSESYRGKWVALGVDLTTIVPAGDTARGAHEVAVPKVQRYFLYQVPATFDLYL